jgi:hypothetical protein
LGELRLLRDQVLLSLYGASGEERTGVAHSFDRAAESFKFVGNADYHDFSEGRNLAQGGVSISRLLRLSPLDDDSPGLRIAGGVQAVRLRDNLGDHSLLRPSFGLVFQDRIQNLQLPDNPFSMLTSERVGEEKPGGRKPRNRQMGLIRWTYQLGVEYLPDTYLSESDSYNLYLRYRIQPKRRHVPVEDWERRITDLTFRVGRTGDRSLFLGFTVTKGIRL